MKTCRLCLEDKPLESFHNDKSRKDGYRSICKFCAIKYVSGRPKIRPSKPKQAQIINNTKLCLKCGQFKTFSEFHKNKYGIGGLRVYCIACTKKYTDKCRKDGTRRSYERKYEGVSTPNVTDSKTCKECNILKDSGCFALNKFAEDGLRDICRQCYAKIFDGCNSEERFVISYRLKMKRYRQNHRERIQKYNNEYKKKRRQENPEIRLRHNISNMIIKKIRKNGESVIPHFSYTMVELKNHLESLFEPWMNWNNYGTYKIGGEKKWQIDHIIPQSKLPYDSMDHPNFQKCWALENLQPMEAIQNIRKNNKMI